MNTLELIAIISLIIGGISTTIIVIDISAGHPQSMMVMNFVYPITALYAGPLALWWYFTVGRKSTKKAVMKAKQNSEKPPNKTKPFWQSVAVGALHCGK